MIKIITTKKYRQMTEEIETLRGSLLNMQQINKGHYNKYQYDRGQYDKTIDELRKEVGDMEGKLHKAWHEKMELMKKLKKYESRGK